MESLAPVPDLQSWMVDRAVMTDLIQQHLQRAKDQMKKQADKGRSERSFAVGNMVYHKLHPYVQSSLVRRSRNKLYFYFFGPFKAIEKLGSVAYKLELPPGVAIHPVFHVSTLKLSPGSQWVSAALPTDLLPFQVPVRVLHRRRSSGDWPMEQGLVQWSQLPPELATWEPLTALR